MMRDCIRWAHLADREAIGESMEREESLFLSEHAAACASCAAEADSWNNLRLQPIVARVAPDEIDAVLERARNRVPAGKPLQRIRRTAAAFPIAAALALAAGLTLAAGAVTIWKVRSQVVAVPVQAPSAMKAEPDEIQKAADVPSEGELRPTTSDMPAASAMEPAAPLVPHPGRPVASSPPESRAPSDLLAQAREERTRGHFAEAAAIYRKIQATNPESSEARVSLVSLGDLQLSHLDDPAGALRSFESYLMAGGGLAQEAWYGKIRALRSLGRSSSERAAIERFLSLYPAAVQAPSLRARLNEIH